MNLVIFDDEISFIGETIPEDNYDKILDLKGHLVMPGLINCHGHTAMTLLRGVGSGRVLKDWLFNAIFPVEEKLTPEDIKAGVEMGMLEMISSGTTSFVDMYDFPYAETSVVADSGMVCNLCRVGIAFDPTEEMDNHIRYNEDKDFIEIIRGQKKGNDELKRELKSDCLPLNVVEAIKQKRINADFCLHSQYLTTEKMVRKMAEDNKDFDANIQVHISETIRENKDSIINFGCTPIEYFNKCGLLDHNVLAAHCVHVTNSDLDIMKEKNVNLVYNPVSNMKLISGMPPIKKALDRGINVALGTDGCASNDNLDMFKEMHTAALLANLQAKNAGAVKASEIVDMATINGAKAIRRHTGLIEVGYKADLIVLDMNKPHLSAYEDIAALLVYSAKGSDVVYSFVDGKMLYDHGKYLTLNSKQIFKKFNKSLKRLGLQK